MRVRVAVIFNHMVQNKKKMVTKRIFCGTIYAIMEANVFKNGFLPLFVRENIRRNGEIYAG